MKALIYLLIPALALTATSCMEYDEVLPDTGRAADYSDAPAQPGSTETPGFDPGPDPDVVITSINAEGTFRPGQEFHIPIDVNQDGNLDFVLTGSETNYGVYYQQTVYLMAAGENKVLTSPDFQSLCSNTIHTVPVEAAAGEIGADNSWYNVGVFYLRTNYNGCDINERYYDMGASAYFGIRLHLDGEDHFGWIQIKTSGPGRNGYPNCSESWAVKKAAYHTIPGEALRSW